MTDNLYVFFPTCLEQDKDKFDDIYTSFLTTVQEMEKFVQAYLHAVFMRKMKTHEGLDLITRYVKATTKRKWVLISGKLKNVLFFLLER